MRMGAVDLLICLYRSRPILTADTDMAFKSFSKSRFLYRRYLLMMPMSRNLILASPISKRSFRDSKKGGRFFNQQIVLKIFLHGWPIPF